MTPDRTLDKKLVHTADLINGILAKLVVDTRQHLARKYEAIDGSSTTKPMAATSWTDSKGQLRHTGNNGSRGGMTISVDGDNVPVTAVEMAMINRINVMENIDQVNDFADSIADNTHNLLELCNAIMRQAESRDTDKPKPDRCEANSGMEGYDLPLSMGGWHDPTCNNLPRSSSGLCNTCRVRLDRWRARMDKKPIAEDRTIHHDSKIVAGQLGTIHAYPITGAA